MAQNLNSCLSCKLARIDVATHIACQILRWENFLTLFQVLVSLLVQIRLENSSISISGTVLKWLSLWIVLIYQWHGAIVSWLRLIRWQPLRCVTSTTSIFWGKLRMILPACFSMLSSTTSRLMHCIIHWRPHKVLWAFSTRYCLICLSCWTCLDNVVILDCSEVEKWFFLYRLSWILANLSHFRSCALLVMSLGHFLLFLILLHLLELMELGSVSFVKLYLSVTTKIW